MKKMTIGLAFAGMMFGAQFKGVITDTMCGAGSHKAMNMGPDEQCVKACVKMDPNKWKYALTDGKNVWVLSDQKTPEKFAAKKVVVTGTLDEKTKTIKVESIVAAK
jgi:hypothetical protein